MKFYQYRILLFYLFAFLSLVSNLGATSVVRFNRELLRYDVYCSVSIDSIPVSVYDFGPNYPDYIENMIKTLVDSTSSKFGCNAVESVFMTLEKKEGCFEIRLKDMVPFLYRSKLPENIKSLARLKVLDTYVFFDRSLIEIHEDWFDNITWKKDIVVDQEGFSYSCLNEEVDGTLFHILFIFDFTLSSELNLKLIDDILFIDSGDTGF